MNLKLQAKIKTLTKDLLYTNPELKKHFSVLVLQNRIISIGQNSSKSHPLNKVYGYRGIYLHSEQDAILKLRWRNIDWSKVVLINTRINIFNQYGMCKPCLNCQDFIRNYGIRTVYFQYNTDGDFEKMTL